MLKRSSNGLRSIFTGLHSLRKSLIPYSTSVASTDGNTTPLMVEYLIKSVGFSKKEAASIATKVSNPSITTEKSQSVVDFLKQTGFDGAQIKKVIASFPDILHNNVDETLKPQIRVLQELGLSRSSLRSIVSRHPHFLGKDSESDIVPVLEMIKSLLRSKEQLNSFVLQVKSQRLFSPDVIKNLTANVQFLQDFGLPSETIKWLMLNTGILFGTTEWVEKMAKRAEKKLGIPRTSEKFTYAVLAVTKKKEPEIESWFEVFRSRGWSETEIKEAIQRRPLSLGLSENTVRVNLKYYMEELSYGSEFLASRPILLSYSLEKRILPRVEVWQALTDSNRLKQPISIYKCLKMEEPMFVAKFVLPHKKVWPELFEKYALATGYPISKKKSKTNSAIDQKKENR